MDLNISVFSGFFEGPRLKSGMAKTVLAVLLDPALFHIHTTKGYVGRMTCRDIRHDMTHVPMT